MEWRCLKIRAVKILSKCTSALTLGRVILANSTVLALVSRYLTRVHIHGAVFGGIWVKALALVAVDKVHTLSIVETGRGFAIIDVRFTSAKWRKNVNSRLLLGKIMCGGRVQNTWKGAGNAPLYLPITIGPQENILRRLVSKITKTRSRSLFYSEIQTR